MYTPQHSLLKLCYYETMKLTESGHMYPIISLHSESLTNKQLNTFLTYLLNLALHNELDVGTNDKTKTRD